VNIGDLLVLGCAVFWTATSWRVERLAALDPFRLCVVQFATCAVDQASCRPGLRADALGGIAQTARAPAYAAFLSTGIGFTLQVVGSATLPASHAALIPWRSGRFAAIGGALVLGEAPWVPARFLGRRSCSPRSSSPRLGVVLSSRSTTDPWPHVSPDQALD